MARSSKNSASTKKASTGAEGSMARATPKKDNNKLLRTSSSSVSSSSSLSGRVPASSTNSIDNRRVSPRRLGMMTNISLPTNNSSTAIVPAAEIVANIVANTTQCAWARHVGKPCSSKLPPPIPCSIQGCDVLVHHLCIIDWETEHNFEGRVQVVCPNHHDHFINIGGGGKAPPPSLPSIDEDIDEEKMGSSHGDSLDSDISSVDDNNKDAEKLTGDEDDIDFGITEFTSDEFEVNERCSYYMNRGPITTENRAAVEFVYMIEADTLVRSQNTLRKPELAVKLLEKYKQLIEAIPVDRFGSYGLRNIMLVKYYGAKTGSASGIQDKIKTIKRHVQELVRDLQLNKLPSGRGIIDMKNKYIAEKYRDVMKLVSEYSMEHKVYVILIIKLILTRLHSIRTLTTKRKL